MDFADKGGACRIAVNEDRMSFSVFSGKKNAWFPNEQDLHLGGDGFDHTIIDGCVDVSL